MNDMRFEVTLGVVYASGRSNEEVVARFRYRADAVDYLTAQYEQSLARSYMCDTEPYVSPDRYGWTIDYSNGDQEYGFINELPIPEEEEES